MNEKRKNVYFDEECWEIIDEMKKRGVNISKFLQDAIKGWIGEANDYNSLKEKLKLLEKDHEEKQLLLNNQKQKSERKIKKEIDEYFSIRNKTLEMMGEDSRKKHSIKNIKDKFTSREQAEKLIKELIENTFECYINYLYKYQLPEGDEQTNENYEEEYSKYSSKFWDKVNLLFEKFMKNYKGTFDGKFFELKDVYSPIKRFVNENSKSFTPNIFLVNEDPNRYETSELYIYMPLKEIEYP